MLAKVLVITTVLGFLIGFNATPEDRFFAGIVWAIFFDLIACGFAWIFSLLAM